MAKPVDELLTECSLRLGDSGRTIWSAAELLRYAKTAHFTLHRETLCFWRQRYLNDQADESEAQLPSDCIMVDRVTWGARPLDVVTVNSLREMDEQYRTLSGAVLAFGLDETRRGIKFRAPTATITSTDPDSHSPTTTSVNNTRLEYFSMGATLAAGGAIDLPNSYAKYMRQYVLWQAYERAGDGQDLKLAAHYQMRWSVGLARIKLIRSRLQSARTRHVGQAAKRGRKIARPVMPYQYGRIVRG